MTTIDEKALITNLVADALGAVLVRHQDDEGQAALLDAVERIARELDVDPATLRRQCIDAANRYSTMEVT